MADADDVNNFLEHFGVKGMKWGVRRGSDGSRPIARTLDQSKFGKLAKANAARYDAKKKAKTDKKADAKWQKSVSKDVFKIYGAATEDFNNRVGGVNARNSKADLINKSYDDPDNKKYLKEVNDLAGAAHQKALKAYPGVNSPSGKLTVVYDMNAGRYGTIERKALTDG